MADERSRRYTMSACYQNDKIQLFLSMERRFNLIWMKLKWKIPILLFKEYHLRSMCYHKQYSAVFKNIFD